MAVSYRFIYSLEVTIKDRQGYYSNLGKNLRGKGGRLFSSKTEIRNMLSRLSVYIPEQIVLKEVL